MPAQKGLCIVLDAYKRIKMWRKIKNLYVGNYYWLYVLVALSQMLGIRGLWTILCWLTFLVGLTSTRGFKYGITDFLVVFLAFYSMLTYSFNLDYPLPLYIQTIRDQITPMAFYFIARGQKTAVNKVNDNMIMPLMFAYVAGLFLFFTQPSWYIEYRLAWDTSNNDSMDHFYNMTRMSSFWSSSYFVGYSSFFLIIYLLLEGNSKVKKYFFLVLSIAVLSNFCSQQRVSIAFLAIFLFYFLLDKIKKHEISHKTAIKTIIISIILVIVGYTLVVTYMDKYYISYLSERFSQSDNDENMIMERINLFEKYIDSISFWGSGLGKYGHNAIMFDMPCISDCEYIRLPNEIGVFGTSIFLIIVILSFIRAAKVHALTSYESFCLAFYLVAMIGATPLESVGQQAFFLWFCIGRLNNSYTYAKG